MTKRSPFVVAFLAFVTFTLYGYYWLYKTTEELRDEAGRDDLSPILDVFLTAVTLGLWGLYASYRNARIIHEEMQLRGIEHADRSIPVALFGALSAVSGWAWLVSMALLQEDLNRLAEAEFDYFEHAEPALKARVQLEPMERPAPAQDHGWSKAPSAPVFRSAAPMPVVY